MVKDNQMANEIPLNNLRKRSHNQTKLMNGKHRNLNSMTIDEQYNAALNVIQNLPKNGSFQASDQMKLKFYAFYKQATEGPNQTPKPSFYEIVNRYKWDAWTKLGNMSKEDAKRNYVTEFKQIIENITYNESDSKFYEKLGPFLELIKRENPKSINGGLNQTKSNGNNQFTKDANYSSSNDPSSGSDDDFSDTVDSLSINGDLKPNLNSSNENDFTIKDQHFDNRNNFEDCTDLNSKLEPEDLINAKGIDAGYMTGQENYFYDCIDKNSVLNPNDIICARGETGIFSSRTNLPSNQEQSNSSRSSDRRQPSSIDNNSSSSSGSSYYQNTAGSGAGGDRNYNPQNSELIDIHEHLALTVLRLQQTIKSISNRIENLETKVNERQIENPRKEIKRQPWWANRTTQTTVLLIIWPFAAHLIITAIKKRVNK